MRLLLSWSYLEEPFAAGRMAQATTPRHLPDIRLRDGRAQGVAVML